MIKVYFEKGKKSNLVATFENEDDYNKIFHYFEKLALEKGYERVVESMGDESFNDYISLEEYRLFTEWREKERYFDFNTNIDKWMYSFMPESSIPSEQYLKEYAKTTKELLTKFRKKMIKFITHNDPSFNWVGGSLQGRINITYAELKKVLGLPHEGDDYKVDAEWSINFNNGINATIYNYKDGKNYNGKSGLPKTKITDWHIGGESEEAVKLVYQLFNQEYANNGH